MINYTDIPLLKKEDIEIKIKQVTEKGAVALLYKTARTDYKYLNQLFGLYNWKCDYKEVKGNLYCTISIYCEERNEWIEKTNCGIESRADEDGNEKKGEASDSLKRAGFTLGIGVELYSAPFTFLKVLTKKNDKGKYELANKYQKFEVSHITYNEDREINELEIIDSDTKEVVFSTSKYIAKKEIPPVAEKDYIQEDRAPIYEEVLDDEASEMTEEVKEEKVYDEVEEDKNTLSKSTKGKLEYLLLTLSKEQRDSVMVWVKKNFNKEKTSELGEFEAQLTISVIEKSLRKAGN